MNARHLVSNLFLSVLSLSAASPVFGLANRVFVSARSGNDAGACDDVNAPCKTFAGAVTKLNPGGEAIVLDSGGYGPVTITQGVTIEAPAGITAFVHPPSGDAITINAGAGAVTLRGLVLSVGTNHGITVNSVGTLNVENCFLTGFASSGIRMISAGQLNVKGTDITGCNLGIAIFNTAGTVLASIDHCHLDGNGGGYYIGTTSPGNATTMASFSTANNSTSIGGWTSGGSGKEVLNLEFCVGSGNAGSGLLAVGSNALSAARFSNSVFANNVFYGVQRSSSGTAESRGNNTMTGNSAPTSGTIGTILPL